MFFLIVFYAFLYWSFWQLIYLGVIFPKSFGVIKPLEGTQTTHRQKVSIIICAKNEEENLRKYLIAALSQQYHDEQNNPLYEVIVANDCSTDGTDALLSTLALEHSHLKVITISPDAKRTYKGKKFPLSLAVKQAAYNNFLFTDADCMPATEFWVENMMIPINAGKEIVAGYAGYSAGAGLLTQFISWETLHSFMQGACFAGWGVPYYAVGRNMACKRYIFEQAQQSPLWHKSLSGDDDLLVNIAANKANYALVAAPKAATHTPPPLRFNQWREQKQRHLSEGKYYKLRIKLLLATYGFTHAAAWLYGIVLLFSPYARIVLAILALRSLIQCLLMHKVARAMQERITIINLVLLDFCWMLYNFAFLPYLLLKNKTEWK